MTESEGAEKRDPSARLFQPAEDEFFNAIASFALSACKPLYWHDTAIRWPKILRGASCFFLKFDSRLVGITAAHVVREFQRSKEETNSLVCQLQNIAFDLEAALISCDDDLDIATFHVTTSDLEKISGVAIDCSGAWPPPTPDRGRALQIVGFPEIIRRLRPDLSCDFAAYGALTMIEDVGTRDVVVTFDPGIVRPMQSPWTLKLPPLQFNMSGCSGGLAMMHGDRNGLHRWFPIGLIVGGPRDSREGTAMDFDIITVRRIHCIQADGTIEKPETGWLPR